MYNKAFKLEGSDEIYSDNPALESIHGLYPDLERKMLRDGFKTKLLDLDEKKIMKGMYDGLKININALKAHCDVFGVDEIPEYDSLTEMGLGLGFTGFMLLVRELSCGTVTSDFHRYGNYVQALNGYGKRKFTTILGNSFLVSKVKRIDEGYEPYTIEDKIYPLKAVRVTDKDEISFLIQQATLLKDNLFQLLNNRKDLIEEIKSSYESDGPRKVTASEYMSKLKAIDKLIVNVVAVGSALSAYPIVK